MRWKSLDAVRGVAALLVLTFHCAQVFPGFAAPLNPLHLATWSEPWSWFRFTPFRLFVTGGPTAVVLFFALSGFVLSLPFLREHGRPEYGSYYVKRVLRIYPPFVAAILISAALYAAVLPVPVPSLSAWFNTVLWDQPLSAGYVGRNLLMTGLRQDMTLDLVMWSLVHELRISLIFPLLFLAAGRAPLLTLSASLLLSVWCNSVAGVADAATIAMTLAETGRFVFLFVAGSLLARHIGAVQHHVGWIGPKLRLGCWLLALALLLFPGPTLTSQYTLIWGAGAVLLIALVAGCRATARRFEAPPLLWLGRVSYSLYLIHLPLLVACVHLLSGVLPLPVILCGVVIPLSLLAAEGMYRCTEEPSIRLGQAIVASLRAARPKPRAPVPTLPLAEPLPEGNRP